jgi:hypothetical protein
MMLAAAAAATLAVATLLPGTFTNEEQVYFAREAGKPVPPWVGIRITPEAGGYRMQAVDAFGVASGEDQLLRVREDDRIVSIRTGTCIRDYARVPLGLTIVNQSGRCAGTASTTTVTMAGMAMTLADGTKLELQRARAFKCAVAIPRKAKKPDGSDDWWSGSGLMLHDAGGRVTATTDEPVPQAFTLRMRNIAWPSGNTAPRLALYVHGADPDHAIADAWADPAATSIGIDLRTMQASCTLAEPPPAESKIPA